jgi:hypothetical protein
MQKQITIISHSLRAYDFVEFASTVVKHIDNYACPQYGDRPNDLAETLTAEECFKQAEKYLSRRKTQQRPDQINTDMLKAVHYIQMGHAKQNKEPLNA